MNKRQFLSTAALGLGAAALPGHAAKPSKTPGGPVLLTLTGAVGKSNRPAFDPAFDQMLGKHKVSFERAYSFDYAMLTALPAVTIKPTLEYDGKPHILRGPRLSQVLKVAGVPDDGVRILLQAIDGYAVVVTPAQIKQYDFILATERDGLPLPLGGLGPLWAVYDADRIPELAGKPLKERFALSPWGVYHIGVQAG
ncbi:molybdopterin-dependent oxidoreductase [Chitinimonas arctica]|uniref:Molybdopterin-dependent oxidoreductase n=1 Tax=Chitinimonas arctica TaxID=2594795 RepID=A0A516SAH9_9NEIS|nr:molybdopterin-dependent oxidoreductase [Chitinimonas arctica]QDQ25155.1 molybdopterin-dependent oxidoreductase [Chitinimonas arctica]